MPPSGAHPLPDDAAHSVRESESLQAAPRTLTWILKLTAAASLAAVIAAVAIYAVQFYGPLSDSPERWGQFGDYLGGVLNPILSVGGLIALLFTIVLQAQTLRISAEQLKLSSKELELTRAELKRSADTAALSQRALERQAEIMARAARVSGLGAMVTGLQTELASFRQTHRGANVDEDLKAQTAKLTDELDALNQLLESGGA